SRWVTLPCADAPSSRVSPSSLTPSTCSWRTRPPHLTCCEREQSPPPTCPATSATTEVLRPAAAGEAAVPRHRLDLDDVSGVRRDDHPAATDVDADVVRRAAEEDEIARLQVAVGHRPGLPLLRRGIVRQGDARG